MYTVSSGGYNAVHSRNFIMSRPNGLPCFLLLIVRSPALFRIGTEEIRTAPNCAMLIRPDVPYQYRGIGGEYVNDWLHFDCDPSAVRQNGLLFHHPIPIGSAVEFTLYIQQIMWEKNYASEAFRDQNIDMLMHVLINNLLQAMHVKDSPAPYHPYTSRLQAMRLSMQSQPHKDFSSAEMAQELGISPSHFQYLYKTLFGVPFKSDLINMRVDHAKGLILNTDLKLEQIALLSGYNNEIHFYRQFKAKTGMTPREYLSRAAGKYESIESGSL